MRLNEDEPDHYRYCIEMPELAGKDLDDFEKLREILKPTLSQSSIEELRLTCEAEREVNEDAGALVATAIEFLLDKEELIQKTLKEMN